MLSATVPVGDDLAWFAGGCGAEKGGTPVAGGANPTVFPSTRTIYYAQTNDGDDSCPSLTCASVTVDVLPAPAQAPTNPTATKSTICAGGSTELRANPGSGADQIRWYAHACGAEYIGDAGSNPGLIVTPTVTTAYYARSLDSATGCESQACSSVVTITVSPSPQPPTNATATPNPAAVGANVQLSAEPGSGGDVVEWFAGSCGGTLLGTGTINMIMPGSETYYARTKNIADGCVSVDCVSVELLADACANVTVISQQIGRAHV
jgi:hypothetical protein